MMISNNTNRCPPGMAPLYEEAVPMANPGKTSLSFAFAFSRLDRIVAELARAKGISAVAAVTLEAPTFDGGSISYRIDLSDGALPATVRLDHEAFTAGNEFFAAVVVPKLEAAIDQLRAGN